MSTTWTSLSVLLALVPGEALLLGSPGALPTSRSLTSPRMLFGGGGKEGEGAGGGMNMMETIKKAQQVGVKVKELQEELANTEVEATAANGGVKVSVSGAQVPLTVTVSDELVAQGAAAVSEAGVRRPRPRYCPGARTGSILLLRPCARLA